MMDTETRVAQAEAVTDLVLDSLAGVVRDYGAHGFDTEAMNAAGFFCAGEIGPVGGQPFLHGFTASLALFRENGG